ncbi:putative membrane protein YuiD [Vitis vinifera]|uniref:Putative membrane protein YuiD n=1 Tax=Vitis vinifera TaxID=29760 RepID=A0A438DTU1_VITVI|nr:putative membrane protein YuiD [Vitis vinifera]RVW97504.1 putative membrane protein YuiD [Vitis vinifera]
MEDAIGAADSAGDSQTTSYWSPPFNLPLISAFLSFAIAQFLKLFTTWYKERRWDSKKMIDSGGMPSSHSATVTALALTIGLQDGTGGPAFAIAIVFACVVMYDASGVRQHAGRQAEVRSLSHQIKTLRLFSVSLFYDIPKLNLEMSSRASKLGKCKPCLRLELTLLNQIVCEFPPEHPLSSSRPLRDSLGHTPIQVVAGGLLGCIVAYLLRAALARTSRRAAVQEDFPVTESL